MKSYFLKINALFFLIVSMFLITVSACKKFADPPSYYEDYGEDSSVAKTRKVLIIGIDGFSGEDLKAAKPAFLDSVMSYSKYSYSILSEANNNDVAAWKSMMTGVSYSTHMTSDSSFTPDPDQNDPDASLPNPNTMLYYLLRYKPLDKSLLITPWNNLANLLIKGASKTVIATDDKNVRDSSIKLLDTLNSAISIINFNSISIAGKQAGFDVANSQYNTAIQNVDSYVRDIMNVIKARKTYSSENWLVIIASNRGPDAMNPNPGFMIAYNPKFKEEEVKKNGQSAPYINHKGSTNQRYTIPDDGGLYNFGTNKPFTIQFSINISSASLSFPFVFGKKLYQNSGGSASGWEFYFGYDKGWSIDFGAKRSSGYRVGGTPYTNTINMRDANWYTITAVADIQSGHRKVRGYTYIGSKDSLDIGSWSTANIDMDVSTDAPLTIGNPDGSHASDEGGSPCQFNIRDIKIFNVALDSATISQTTCLQDITKHPYYNNLIGYWPCDEAAGAVMVNQVLQGYDFIADGGFSWNVLDATSLPCYIPNTQDVSKNYSIVPQNADIALNALYWLRMDINTDWGLEGVSWISNFENEFNSTN